MQQAKPATDHDHSGNYKGPSWFIRWLCLIAGALIGFFSALAIWLPEITERWKFIATNLFSFLALIVIVAQAVIYQRQREIMNEALGQNKKLLKAVEDQRKAMHAQAAGMAAQARIMHGQLEAVNKQEVHLFVQAKAAKRQTKIMRDSLRIGSRAYVGISDVGVNLNDRTLYIKVGNIGNAPADQIHIHVEIVLAPENKAYSLEDYDYGSFKLLKGDFNIQIIAILQHLLPDTEFGRIKRSESLLIVQGWIDYRDGFGPAPRSEFSLRYSVSADMWITRTEHQPTGEQAQ